MNRRLLHISLLLFAALTLQRFEAFRDFCALNAQNPSQKSITVDGHTRSYLLYVPQSVTAGVKPAGLIMALHGYNSSMHVFFDSYGVKPVADALNYLVVAPQALPEQNTDLKNKVNDIKYLTGVNIPLDAVWGCGLKVKATALGGILSLLNDEINKDVDDVSFLETLIRTTLADFNLKEENIFFVGTSMGGYMSHQYAMYQPVKLTAFVDIVGSMGLNIKAKENKIATPVCIFHSTDDAVVPYSGTYYVTTALGNVPVELATPTDEVVSYWASANSAGAPDTTTVNYYPSSNGKTVEKITYPHTKNEVVFYKIRGAAHDYFFRRSNGDCMDYMEEVEKFIRAHAVDNSGHNETVTASGGELLVYPNPAHGTVYINIRAAEATIYDLAGRKRIAATVTDGSIDVSSLARGVYILKVRALNGRNMEIQTKKLIIR
jgi:poly(3-hydroxybutyrate) depolymerase